MSEIPMPEIMPELPEPARGGRYRFEVKDAQLVEATCPCISENNVCTLIGQTCLCTRALIGVKSGSVTGTLYERPCLRIQNHYEPK